MDTIGIIGAGQMGAGIAQVAALCGLEVILNDRELAIAEKARDAIGKRLARLVEKDKLSDADAAAALARIAPASDYAPMAEAAFRSSPAPRVAPKRGPRAAAPRPRYPLAR